MALEIERKYLVVNDAWRAQTESSAVYRQGYLSLPSQAKPATVRIRVAGDAAWLTIKGPTHDVSRLEFEYSIPPEDADLLLSELCPGPLVEKTRHIVVYQGLRWEVDEFGGDNMGLLVAEVELESPDVEIPFPAWVGAEVSSEARYYNAALSVRPFNVWTDAERAGALES